MNRIWIGGVAVVAVIVAVVATNPGQSRSSDALLVKAQSVFTQKARNELILRQLAQGPAASTATAAGKPAVIASKEAVAFPEPSARENSRRGPRTLTAEDLKSLRARSPEFADAMKRYM